MPYFLSVTDATGKSIARDTAPDSHTYAQLVRQLAGLMGVDYYYSVTHHTADGGVEIRVCPAGRDAPSIEGFIVWYDDEDYV